MRRLLAVVLVVVAAACGGGEGPATYEVILDVSYTEELRVPGFGYVLHEFSLDYQLGAVTPPGELAEPTTTGSASWTVRCFEDPFAPDQAPFAEFAGTHPAIFDWDRADLRRSNALESGVDWTEPPAVLLAETEDSLQVVHRVPAAIAADRAIGCDPGDQYTAIALSLGNAAMTAPGRVNIDGVDLSRAKALNEAAGTVSYVLDEAGSGWLVFEIGLDDVAEVATPFVYTYEPSPDPEGGATLRVDGSVRRAPAE